MKSLLLASFFSPIFRKETRIGLWLSTPYSFILPPPLCFFYYMESSFQVSKSFREKF